MKYIVCFGKVLMPDGTLDWILESRLKETLKEYQSDQNRKIVLLGGHSLYNFDEPKDLSEAETMRNYLAEIPNEKLILEKNSHNTAQQVLILTRDYFLKEDFEQAVIISDKLHLNRVRLLCEAMYKDMDKLSFREAPLKLTGNYLRAIEKVLGEYLEIETNNIALLPRYDLDTFKSYIDAYLRLREQEPDPAILIEPEAVFAAMGRPDLYIKPQPQFQLPIRETFKNFINNEEYELRDLSEENVYDELVPKVIKACNEPRIYNRMFAAKLKGQPYNKVKAWQLLFLAYNGWQDNNYFLFGMFAPNGELAGVLDIKSAELHSAEIGYWASESHRGIASNAVKTLCKLAKNAGYLRLHAYIALDNAASMKVVTNAGFNRMEDRPFSNKGIYAYFEKELNDENL